MGNLLCRCVEVRTAIELPFGVMSAVGSGIHVLDGSPHASRGGCCFWRGFWHRSAFSSNKYPDILISIINSCVKNWQYFRLHGIPLNSASNSLSLVRFKIEVGVDTKCIVQNVTLNTRKLPAVVAYSMTHSGVNILGL